MLLASITIISLLAGCNQQAANQSQPQTQTPTQPQTPSDSAELSLGAAAALEAGPGTIKATSTQDFELKLGHVIAVDSPYNQGSEYLAQLVNQRTNGHVKITVFPAAQLGAEVDLFEGLTMNTLDMALTASAPLLNFCPEVGIIDIPFLFDNYEHAYAVLDSDIGMSLLSSLENAGVIGLAFYEGDFMTLHMTSVVKTLDDMKGKRIRTMENQLHKDFINYSGGVAIPMAFSEVYTSLSNNTIDGGIQNMCQVYATNFYIPSPHQAMTRHVYNASPMMISKATWDKLPSDYQAILKESAMEAASWQRNYNHEFTAEKMEIMADAGCTFDEVDLDAFRAVGEQIVAKYIPSVYSQELYDAIKNTKY